MASRILLLALCLLGACAFATAATAEIKPAEFNTMMLDINNRLKAGEPVQELTELLDAIWKRIKDAYDNEVKPADFDDDQRVIKLKEQIQQKEEDITDKESTINTLTSEIDLLGQDIEKYTDQLDEKKALLKDKKEQLTNGTRDRDAANEDYKQKLQDADEVIAACEEIQGIVANSTLEANQDDGASSSSSTSSTGDGDGTGDGESTSASSSSAMMLEVASQVRNTLKRHALQSLLDTVSTIKDENVRALVDTAAITAQLALAQGDVDDLNELVAKLIAELEAYKNELKEAETTAQKNWEDRKAILEKEIADLEAEIKELQDKLDQATVDKEQKTKDLATAKEDLDTFKTELKDLQEELEQLRVTIEADIDAYNKLQARRQAELDTIEKIREIVDSKLKTMEDHVKERVKDVTVKDTGDGDGDSSASTSETAQFREVFQPANNAKYSRMASKMLRMLRRKKV